ncbi:MAG: HEAT repeat domain-containing protein [Candidatus Binatia bacterium]
MDELTAVIAALESRDKRAIRGAVDALIPLANESPPVATRLNQLLNEPQRANRWPIAYVLANLPHPSQATIQVLLDTLDSEDPEIRWAIALLLVKLARQDENILTRLVQAVSLGKTTQRRMAVYCVRDLSLSDHASLRTLVEALRDPDPMVRVAATTSLKARSDVGSDEENELLRLFLEDPDGRVRNAAVVTLAQLGASSNEFHDALVKARAGPDPQIQKAAAQALSIIQKKRSAPSGS